MLHDKYTINQKNLQQSLTLRLGKVLSKAKPKCNFPICFKTATLHGIRVCLLINFLITMTAVYIISAKRQEIINLFIYC